MNGAGTPEGQNSDVKPPVSVVKDIRAAVKDGLVGANDSVRTAIVASYVKDEVDKRVKATTSVLEKVDALETEIRKVKPTFAGFNEAGTPIGDPLYTNEQVKSLKESREKLAKYEKALEQALVNSDFTKVFELGGK